MEGEEEEEEEETMVAGTAEMSSGHLCVSALYGAAQRLVPPRFAEAPATGAPQVFF